MTVTPTSFAGDVHRTALVVDDVPSTRLIVGTWLRRNGFEVLEAGSATEAEHHLHETVPDVVILDVNLPDRSGLDVCEKIKSVPRTAAVPVLHVSATATHVRDRTAGLDGGADAYLVEPLDREVFVSTVFALLRHADGRRRAERFAAGLTAVHAATLEVNAARSYPDLLEAAVRGASAIADDTDGKVVVAIVGRHHAYVAAGRAGTEPEPCRALSRKEALKLLALDAQGDQVALPDLPEVDGPVAVVGSGEPGFQTALLLLDPARVARTGEQELFARLVHVIARASERLETFEREHEIAHMLQRALLPETLPAPTGLTLAARYTASGEHTEVGGDFYEVLELDGGRVGAAIGDVQGHSLRAAIVMAEIRHALRAYALLGATPTKVLEQLNEMMLRFHPDVVASVCYVEVTPSTGELHYANAGHIPPLVVEPDGGSRFLEEVRPLLGVPFEPPATSTDVLPAGATLTMVTDGLIERRRRDLQTGLDRLTRLCVEHAGDTLEQLADRILDEVAPRNPTDDIAVLLVRRLPLSAGPARR